jgi:breast cancer 2 susceptibility protein
MLQAVMQNKVAKKVEKALEVADLGSRDVTPFLKVRVVGLVSKGSVSKGSNKEGQITVWNPTEMQVWYNHPEVYNCFNAFYSLFRR